MKTTTSRSTHPIRPSPSSNPDTIASKSAPMETTPSSAFAKAMENLWAEARAMNSAAANAPHSAVPTSFTPMWKSFTVRTTLIDGPNPAITATIIPAPRTTFRPMSSATRTSTTMATGATILPTATSGSLTALKPDGHLTMSATGLGPHPGDGPGSTTIPGATRHSTTAAGSTSRDVGDGSQVLRRSEPSMLQRSLYLSGVAPADSAATSAGSR